jgi:hypothetical protein
VKRKIKTNAQYTKISTVVQKNDPVTKASSRNKNILSEDFVRLPLHEYGCTCAKNMSLWLVSTYAGKRRVPPIITCRASAYIFAMSAKKRYIQYFEAVPIEEVVINVSYRPLSDICFGRDILEITSPLHLRVVDDKAVQELGASLVAALHLDETPLDIVRDNLLAKPHFNVTPYPNMSIKANLRGSALPRSALQFAAKMGVH